MTHSRFFALFALVVTLGFSSTSAAPTRGATHGGNSELTSGLARWMTRLVQDAMQSAVLQGDATLGGGCVDQSVLEACHRYLFIVLRTSLPFR